ncbi:MAG: hypothetical protein ACNA8W_21400, partial [Bradymonadaceae bacterium]
MEALGTFVAEAFAGIPACEVDRYFVFPPADELGVRDRIIYVRSNAFNPNDSEDTQRSTNVGASIGDGSTPLLATTIDEITEAQLQGGAILSLMPGTHTLSKALKTTSPLMIYSPCAGSATIRLEGTATIEVASASHVVIGGVHIHAQDVTGAMVKLDSVDQSVVMNTHFSATGSSEARGIHAIGTGDERLDIRRSIFTGMGMGIDLEKVHGRVEKTHIHDVAQTGVRVGSEEAQTASTFHAFLVVADSAVSGGSTPLSRNRQGIWAQAAFVGLHNVHISHFLVNDATETVGIGIRAEESFVVARGQSQISRHDGPGIEATSSRVWLTD